MPATRPGTVARSLVWGNRTDRVRAVWRIGIPIFAGLIAFVGSFAVASTFDLPAGRVQVVPFVTTPIVVYGVVRGTARYLDRRPMTAYGYRVSRDWWLDAVGGVALGTVIVLLTGLIGYQVGSVNVSGAEPALSSTSALWLAVFFVGFVGVAFWEELVFRGVFVLNGVEGVAERGYPRSIAVAAALLGSSAVFAIVHVPGGVAYGQPPSLIALWTLSFGLLTGIAFLLSGELALPMGLHLAINFVPINVVGLSPTATMDGVPTVVTVESAATGVAAPTVGLPITVANVVGCALVAGWCYWRRDGLDVGLESADRFGAGT